MIYHLDVSVLRSHCLTSVWLIGMKVDIVSLTNHFHKEKSSLVAILLLEAIINQMPKLPKISLMKMADDGLKREILANFTKMVL